MDAIGRRSPSLCSLPLCSTSPSPPLRRPAPAGREESSTGSALKPFFFQAEDGIRDTLVTGVQTCALPISRGPFGALATPRSGNSASQPRRTYGWTSAISQTSCPRNAGLLGMTTVPTSRAVYRESACPRDRKSVVQGKRGELGATELMRKEN